jgi:hypothetical protein
MIVVVQDCANSRAKYARRRRNKKRCQCAVLGAQLGGNRQGFSTLRLLSCRQQYFFLHRDVLEQA